MAKILDSNNTNSVTEYFLGINEFNRPTVWNDVNATYTLLIRLILLEPGTYPNHPKMGVGLVSRYRYAKGDEILQLQNDIEDQIATYLPQFTSIEVELTLTSTKDLFIQIVIDGIAYELIYRSEFETLEAVKEEG
jgi:hypothetical protein